jgi:cytidylate kinase
VEKLRLSDKDPAMTNVLTIEREYGSGAAAIARNVAARLGWKLWDQLLTDEICRRMECDRQHVERHEERRDPLHYRLFKAFLRGSFEGSLNEPRMRVADAESIRHLTEELVRAAAAEGNAVIVGRGSAYYLRDRPHAFHVFIYAPFEEKVRRLQLEERTQAEAVELAESVDRERSAFIKQHFGVEWPARHFFHLMVNSTIGDDAAVRTIVDVLSAVQVGKTIAARGRADEH